MSGSLQAGEVLIGAVLFGVGSVCVLTAVMENDRDTPVTTYV